MFEEFRELVNNRHDYAREWKKRKGGRALGYFCCYAPEEVAYAAGILPVRIVSSHMPQDLSEPHIYTMYCPFSKDCLGEGLKGTYHYLDGVFMGQSCLHIRQCFSSWRLHIPGYSRYIWVPVRVQDPQARSVLTGELEDFKTSLEKWLGQAISEDGLRQAIEVYDTNRRLLRTIFELRRQDPPPLTGEEAACLVEASMFADKAEVNVKLERLLHQLPRRRDGPAPKPRLMVAGGENHDLELLKVVEGTGANIVIDDLCFGTRYFWNPTPEYDNPLEAIAARYLEKPSCPTKELMARRRPSHILGLIQDWNVQGVLQIQQKFCDPHEFDIPVLAEVFKQNDIPSYFLELDTTLAQGQIRTRTQAFLEMLELEV